MLIHYYEKISSSLKCISRLPHLFVSLYLLGATLFIVLTNQIIPFFLNQPSEFFSITQTLSRIFLTATFIYWISHLLAKKLCLTNENCKTAQNALMKAYQELISHQEKESRTLRKFRAETLKHQEAIKFISSHDAITKLPNRLLFAQQLSSYINSPNAKNSTTAVLSVEIKEFRTIHSSLGHDAADEFLVALANRLTAYSQNTNHVARINGSEFFLLIPNLHSLDEIKAIITTVITLLQQPWKFRGKIYMPTVNSGVSMFPLDATDASRLMKMAEIAMQRSREQGLGKYQYYMDDMELNIAKRLEIETDLRTAIREQQFLLYYQPQVDKNDKIVGVEALIRWNHPLKGLISPADFIPIAEECDAILPIGEWVIKTACQHNKIWQDMGLPPISVSINLSAKQFRQTNLQQIIYNGLLEANLDPKWLTVEITETAAMSNAEYTTTVLQDLKNRGIKISLDDFGIGYSSLIYLKRFPVDMLKIDRSFISDIGDDSDGACIAKTILGLGHNLNLEVVAEGVETLEQLKFLRQENCSHIQGFLFSRPIPFEEMTQKFKSQQMAS